MLRAGLDRRPRQLRTPPLPPPWSANSGTPSRAGPTGTPPPSLPPTSDSSSWPRHWARSASSPSTQDSAPDARSYASTHKEPLLHAETIYPLEPHNADEAAADRLADLVSEYGIEAIAVGNGTGGREAQSFVRGAGLGAMIDVLMVSEAGASVYSASEVAREELPDQDVTIRGAVSIGRRLLDPPCRTRQDRSQIHRCRTVPARR